MAGIMSMPTAAVVAGPGPDMAPENMQARTVAQEIPPVMGPAKDSARFTSRLETPAASMSAPARIKAGSAVGGKATGRTV